jgi:putative two-component system response regulator
VKTIFAVDDSDTNLSMVETALEDIYNVMTIPSAAKMFEMLGKITPDVILLDIEMPGMNGFETIKILKSSNPWADIPVIFLTGRNDPAVEVQGLEHGAVDFITKPFSEIVLQKRIMIHLNIDRLIRERTEQLTQLQNSIMYVLSDMVENRDKGTKGHVDRITLYIRLMIDEIKRRGLYQDEIQDWDEEKFTFSTRMHDLGKISVSDIILNKPGKLTEEEFEMMKTHASEGERIIDEIMARTGEGDFLHYAKLFAGFHHERWDGTGYPRRLKGTEIPLQGRLLAVADVYDAIVSDRPYHKALTHDEAVKIIMESAGTQFDPNITGIFFELKDQFKKITEMNNKK